jgi:hypothetical protein
MLSKRNQHGEITTDSHKNQQGYCGSHDEETYRIWLEFAEQVPELAIWGLFPSAKNGLPNEASSAVKNKRRLKQSIASVKFMAFAIAAMLVRVVKYPSGCTIVPIGNFAIFLFIDAIDYPWGVDPAWRCARETQWLFPSGCSHVLHKVSGWRKKTWSIKWIAR